MCDREHIPMFMLLRDAVPQIVSRSHRLRHIERAARGLGTPAWTRSMKAFIDEALDDLFELSPTLNGVAWHNRDLAVDHYDAALSAWWHIADYLSDRSCLALSLTDGRAVDVTNGSLFGRIVMPSDSRDHLGDLFGSMEVRLSELAEWPGVPASSIEPALHRELRYWRDRAWSLIGESYEVLVRGLHEPLRSSQQGFEVVHLLRSHVRAFQSMQQRFRTAYYPLSEEDEIRSFLGAVIVPVREQVATIGGKLSALRSR